MKLLCMCVVAGDIAIDETFQWTKLALLSICFSIIQMYQTCSVIQWFSLFLQVFVTCQESRY